MWRLNNMLLNNKFITEEIKEKLKKYLKTKENENIVGQNLREAAKQLWGRLLAIQAYLNK